MSPWLVSAILSAVFAALTAIFAKIGVQGIDSTAATFVRTLVIAVTLFGIVTARHSMPPLNSISVKTYFFLVLSALATGASWICYFHALQLGDAAKVAPIDKFSVILVAIMGATFLGERLSWVNWAGVVLTSIGLLMVAMR
ncbi:MAG: EamA family transporter [Hyphomicrobium sp.]|uniref:EamA family transporter n=1 Tax=Hyphomicrobium sp. TaxID=82 RepID=UPI0039E259EC